MLDRRRRKKGYGVVPQQEAGEGDDLELGEGAGSSGQENGVVEEAWDEMGGEGSTEGEGGHTPSSTGAGDGAVDVKK